MGSCAELVSSLVNPRALHSHPSIGVASSLMQKLRPACLSAVWGSSRKLRAPELVFTQLVKGHRVDPVQYATARSMKLLRHMLTECPVVLADFHKVWWAYENGASRVPGPIGVLKQVLRNMNWTWITPDLLHRPALPNLSINSGPNGWWHHQIRDGLRIAEWKKVAARRKDCVGLESHAGIDRDVTLSMLQSCKTLPLDKGLLRSILSGSLRLGERLFKASIWPSPTCMFCGHEDESVHHCFWVCPAWDHLRLDPDLPSHSDRLALPPCTLECGIFIRSLEEVEHECSLRPVDHQQATIVPLMQDESETFDGEAVVVWTDGACPNNQCRFLRRAGCGIYYGSCHPRNRSFALPGPEQTNNRAELMACIAALEAEPRTVQIRTDSKYVIDGVSARGRRKGNEDLWSIMQNTLQTREPSSHAFVKVKGHAKDIHVQAGVVLLIDKVGNDEADSLAVLGAESHAVPQAIVEHCVARFTRAKACHRMMLNILRERQKAEKHLKGENADEFLEDVGEDPWLDCNIPIYVPHPRSGEG